MTTPADTPTKPHYPADLYDKTLEMISKSFMSTDGLKDGSHNPLTFHMFYPPLLFGMMPMLQETVLVNGQLSRMDKETLASFVSNSNRCVFCTNAHQTMAESLGADLDELQRATEAEDPLALSNKRPGEIIKWMLAAQKKNAPEISQINLKEEVPEIIGTAFKFNYINRVVDTFVTREKMLPKKEGNSTADRLLKKKRAPPLPGSAVEIMELSLKLPDDFSWAESNGPISQVYIPQLVTDFVGKYIDENYDGSKPPLSRRWVFEVAEKLDGTESEEFAAAFMLLVSFARFQIDESLKKDFESHYQNFDTRRAMCAWAAFQTARRIAGWQGEALSRHLKKYLENNGGRISTLAL
ncbi:hypothetical protein BSKO_08254 [Bryopsis sp. KO-2023]|nr:hypothetical protein BSKO_08254 [Bryopsis sp. KO-2023]